MAQDRAQAAAIATFAGWRGSAGAAGLLAALERYGAGAALADCPELAALFRQPGRAAALVGDLTRRLAATLAEEPLAHPPLRHGFDGAVSTLLLARGGRAHLTLIAREPGRYPADSAVFADAERREIVLAGQGEGRRLVRPRLAEAQPLALRPGATLALDRTGEAMQVLAVTRRLVTLRLDRPATAPHPSETLAVPSGDVLHRSAGDIRTSRHELMLAVLGRMKGAGAAPVMAQMALEPGDPSLRWQALRECLALDSAEGFRALVALTRADDPLAQPAQALRAQLLDRWPQLAALEAEPCPA